MAACRTRSRRAFLRIPLAFFLFSLVVAPNILPVDQEVNPPSLSEILEKAAAYCRRFGTATLNYVCIEDLREAIYIPYRRVPTTFSEHIRRHYNHFVYDYQLVKVGEKINEQRKLLEKNGVRKTVPAAPPRMGRFGYQLIILGPMILSEYWQQYHDYRISGRAKVGKEDCVIIEAVPKPSAPVGHLFGKVWLKEQDGRILKLEWYQESIQNYEIIEETARALKAKPQVRMTMEYLFEKNGIGFPSRCLISEDYVTNERGFRLILSETTITYKGYKFFTVETEVKTKE
jgi:hypothetical protein